MRLELIAAPYDRYDYGSVSLTYIATRLTAFRIRTHKIQLISTSTWLVFFSHALRLWQSSATKRGQYNAGGCTAQARPERVEQNVDVDVPGTSAALNVDDEEFDGGLVGYACWLTRRYIRISCCITFT